MANIGTKEFPQNEDIVAAVREVERVTAYLGHWPTFTDVDVVSFHLERVPVRVVATSDLRVTFQIFDLSKALHDPERKQALLELLFEGIAALTLKGWNHQNQIAGLSLQRGTNADSPTAVRWGHLGHDVSFDCASISVCSLRELNPFRESLRDV